MKQLFVKFGLFSILALPLAQGQEMPNQAQIQQPDYHWISISMDGAVKFIHISHDQDAMHFGEYLHSANLQIKIANEQRYKDNNKPIRLKDVLIKDLAKPSNDSFESLPKLLAQLRRQKEVASGEYYGLLGAFHQMADRIGNHYYQWYHPAVQSEEISIEKTKQESQQIPAGAPTNTVKISQAGQ